MNRLFIIIIFILSLTLLLFACKDDIDIDDTTNNTQYSVSLYIEDDLKTISLTENILGINKTGGDLEMVVLNSFANAYRETAPQKAYFTALDRYGSLDITKIQVNSTDVEWQESSNGTAIKIGTPIIKNADEFAITITGTYQVPFSNLKFGLNEGVLNFTEVLPTLAVYQNDAWRIDNYSRIGDPYYAEIADYDVDITALNDLTIAYSGDLISNTSAENRTTHKIQAKSIRSFGFSASENFHKTIAYTSSEITLYYYSIGDDITDKFVSNALNALNTFSDLIEKYPYQSYSIVENNIYYGSVSCSNLAFIKASKDDAYKAHAIIKETIHQWFGLIVESDSIKSPWLDESLTAFLIDYYYFKTVDAKEFLTRRSNVKKEYEEYENNSTNTNFLITKTVYQFNFIYDFNKILHGKGSMLYDDLFYTAGSGAFDRIIRDYYLSNKFSIATLDSLSIAIRKTGNSDSAFIKGLDA
ncbi:MAG: hypothetical protein LBF68_01215 [Christensenellaceae bacterium]|jgi:hypothetical protein|nr:hypothetical protein [Christensenellaceae bacterium]